MTLKQITQSTPVSLGVVASVIVAAITLSYWFGRGHESLSGRITRVEEVTTDHEHRLDRVEGRDRVGKTPPLAPPLGDHSILVGESRP